MISERTRKLSEIKDLKESARRSVPSRSSRAPSQASSRTCAGCYCTVCTCSLHHCERHKLQRKYSSDALNSTYKSTYLPAALDAKPSQRPARTGPIAPLPCSHGLGETTSYQRTYTPKNIDAMRRQAKERELAAPLRFEGTTSYQDDYKRKQLEDHRQTKVVAPEAPRPLPCSHTLGAHSTYDAEFPRRIGSPVVHRKAGRERLPSQPFDATTTYRVVHTPKQADRDVKAKKAGPGAGFMFLKDGVGTTEYTDVYDKKDARRTPCAIFSYPEGTLTQDAAHCRRPNQSIIC
eukprot:Rmarinus@m.21961